eukprot:3346-Heterococcus_DN1.PRE.2
MCVSTVARELCSKNKQQLCTDMHAAPGKPTLYKSSQQLVALLLSVLLVGWQSAFNGGKPVVRGQDKPPSSPLPGLLKDVVTPKSKRAVVATKQPLESP